MNWGIGQGLKGERYAEYWDPDRGYSLIPHFLLPGDLESLIEGGHLEVESLPAHLAGKFIFDVFHYCFENFFICLF